MSRNLVLAVVALLILLLVLVGGFFVFGQSLLMPTPVSQEVTLGEPHPSSVLTGTFSDLTSLEGDLECQWQLEADEEAPTANTGGTVWKSGNQVRSTFESGGDTPMQANALMRDGTVYSWVEVTGMAPIGFSMSEAAVADATKTLTPEQQQQAVQYRQRMEFNCRPWTADSTKFDLPTGIEFKPL